MASTARYDGAATALSLSCVAHCVALPVFAAASPFIAAIAQAEWVHWALTAFSIAVSAFVMSNAHDARKPAFLVPTLSGIALLTVALFAETFGVDETLPTMLGGVLLAGAHIFRLIKHR